MRLPLSAHTDQPWRVHEITRDFRLEDVWSFRTPGAGPDDFPAMLEAMRTRGGFAEQAPVVKFLFAVRWKLGALFGWDAPEDGIGKRVRSLRDRLPGDLRDTVDASAAGDSPFDPVYRLGDEAVNELANKTVHTLMHLGWVPTARGEHELRMAVLVKPNGRFGRFYMALIAPFRHLIVYPALTRQWERAWRNRTAGAPPAVTAEVGAREVPEPVRALSNLPAIDYVDRFTVATDTDATPEQWARAMFGDVPTPGERLIWQGILGLRLSRGPSPDTVAGWRIADRGEGWILLEAASGFLSGNLLVQTTGERTSLSTFLHYDRPLGRALWPPLSAVHRTLAPRLLREAATKVNAA
ncbi:DUF2867 domain-containing protein [Spirillospora sp. NPDC052242]